MRLFHGVLLALTACGTELPPDSHGPDGPDGGTSSTEPPSSTSDGGAPASPDGGTAALTDCQDATTHSDLAWIQTKVFNVSCLTGCHSGANPSSQMDLSSGHAWASLVNVPSNTETGWTRVVPNDSRASFLMVKLKGEPGPTLDAYMPWNQPTLCTEKLDAIRRWIVAGAPNQ